MDGWIFFVSQCLLVVLWYDWHVVLSCIEYVRANGGSLRGLDTSWSLGKPLFNMLFSWHLMLLFPSHFFRFASYFTWASYTSLASVWPISVGRVCLAVLWRSVWMMYEIVCMCVSAWMLGKKRRQSDSSVSSWCCKWLSSSPSLTSTLTVLSVKLLFLRRKKKRRRRTDRQRDSSIGVDKEGNAGL